MKHIEINEKFSFSLGFTELSYAPNNRDKNIFINFLKHIDVKKENEKFFCKFFYTILKPQNPALIRVEHGDIFGLMHFFISLYLKNENV